MTAMTDDRLLSLVAEERAKSVASGSPANGNTVLDLIYWDFALSAAFRMNPSTGTGPTPYVF